MRVVVYDQVDTFGRQLRNGLAGLPTSFTTLRDQFSGAYAGCTFGTSGSEVGGCLNDVFQSIRSEEHTSELQSLMRISYAVFCLKKKKKTKRKDTKHIKH